MENATKALEMAGGVLITLIIIGTIVFFYNRISEVKQTEHNAQAEEQAADFNKDYEVYNRNDVYGSELLSLANQMQDYNTREVEKGYEKIELSATFKQKSNIFIQYYGNKQTYSQSDLASGYTKLANEINKISTKKITDASGQTTKTYNEWVKISKTTLKSTLKAADYDSIINYQDLINEQTNIARGTFRCTDVKYKNSRIVKMTFYEN